MDKASLQKELDLKIAGHFQVQKSYIDYLVQTQSNFLYRYLETSTDKDLIIKSDDGKTFYAKSFESNMGDALKLSLPEVKNGVKALAKSVPREEKPAIMLYLASEVKSISDNEGVIVLTSIVSWDFPEFNLANNKLKTQKSVVFEFSDPHQFRKNLALKFEEVCSIFE